jgi:hypothetical protein
MTRQRFRQDLSRPLRWLWASALAAGLLAGSLQTAPAAQAAPVGAAGRAVRGSAGAAPTPPPPPGSAPDDLSFGAPSPQQAQLVDCPAGPTALLPAVITPDHSTRIRITGNHFVPASTLQLTETLLIPLTFVSPTLLSTVVPAGLPTGWYTATLSSANGCVTILVNALRVDGPHLADLTVNGGARATTAVTVTVGLVPVVGEGAASVSVSLSDDAASWSPWRPIGGAQAWTLTAGDGPKTVYARSRDMNGNISPVISATVLLDTAAWTGAPGVSINQGAYYATQVTTTLTLSAPPGTASMQVSGDPAFPAAPWEPYRSRRPWTMTPNAGLGQPSLVYARFKDLGGAVSAAYQADIIIDSRPPAGTFSVAGVVSGTLAGEGRGYSFDENRYLRLTFGAPQAANINLPVVPATTTLTVSATCPGCFVVQLNLPAADDLSGVGAMRVGGDAAFSGADWELYSVHKLLTVPPGGMVVYAQYRDLAGNVSPVYMATVPPWPAASLPRLVPNHLGTEKAVLADYMMWYGPDTFDGKMTWDVPVAGPYNSGDPAIIRRQVAEAQQACLDGFAAHWYGPTDPTTTNNFDALLAASVGTTLRHSIVIQTNILPGANEQMIVDAINYVVTHWAQDPHYLRLGGRPVLTFTDMPRPWDDPLKALAGWERIRDATDPGHTMIWMAEGLYPTYNPVFDGLFVYRIDHRDYQQGWLQQPRWAKGVHDLEAQLQGSMPLGGLYFADSISPGFDNTRLANSPVNFSSPAPVFARDRQNGGYYADTFAVTAQTGGDFMYVKSFNEWIEGTEIEPGLTYGSRYLDLTCQYANAYRGR